MNTTPTRPSYLARKLERVRELRRKGMLAKQLGRRFLGLPRDVQTAFRYLLWHARTRTGMKELAIEDGIRLHVAGRLEYLIYVHNFERPEREFVRRFFARRAGTFVDAGANVGLFTLIAANALRGRGTVHAFEPCSETFHQLTANVGLNELSNVRLNQLALSSEAEPLMLHAVGDGWNAFNSMVQPILHDSQTTEQVDCTTLDQYVAASCPDGVDLVKIDVEGWEEKVLDGANELLSGGQAPVLLVEFCDATAANAGSSCVRLRERIEGFGYKVYRYDARRNELNPEPYRTEYPYENLICTKDPATVLDRLR